MKIALCTSPHLDHNFYYHLHSESSRSATQPFVPLGLLSLAACLEKRSDVIEILDLNKFIGEDLFNGRDFYKNIAVFIQKSEPDILGFMTEADSYHHILMISRECKKLLPNVKILLGGPHASVTDYETLKNFPFIDIIIRGEGETSIVELMDCLKTSKNLGLIKGISYRSENGAIIQNVDRPLIDNLDNLPIPAYHLYNISFASSVYVEVGRGCPYACTFCFTAPYWKRRHRIKSSERIFHEITLLMERYHIRHFIFIHDLFTMNQEWVRSFCNDILRRNLDITWSCSSRTDTIDVDLVDLMSNAGCKAIYYGLEVGSKKTKVVIKKRLNVQKALHIISQTISHGIEVTVGLMLGFPHESENSIRKTFRLFFTLLKMDVPKVNIFRVCPFKGSLMYENYKDMLYFDGHFLDLPLCKTLREENLENMRGYPEIFSGYYRYKTELEDEDFLKGVDELSPIMGLLRYPIMAILGATDDGLGLIEGWTKWIFNYNQKHCPANSLTHYGTVEDFLLFLGEIAQKNKKCEYITDLIEYEKIKNEFRNINTSLKSPSDRDSAEQICIHPTVNLQAKNGYMKVLKFNYDIKRIIEQIRNGNVNRVEKESCYIVFYIDKLGELNTAKIKQIGAKTTPA